MRDLCILGTGPHAAEMVEIVDRVNRATPRWNLLGFIAASDDGAGEVRNGYPVLGGPEVVAAYPDAEFVTDCDWTRRHAVPRERLVSLIDPAAFVSRTAVIGAGCVLYPNCFVGHNARLGDEVFVLGGSIINHDDVLEDRVIVASGVSLAGHVHIEPDCYLGQASTIRQYLRIGRNSMIGMGAVVIGDVAPNSVMVGNPARRLRDREK